MQLCFPRAALGALCAASALLLSACGGDDGPAPDPSLVEVVRPTDQPCAIVASTPASGAVNAAVNVETTVIYTGPSAGACRDLRLTDAAGSTVPTDTLFVNEWAHPDGGIVGTVSLQPKADLRPAADFTVVRGQERLLSFRAGSTRAGLPVSAIDQPVRMTGLPQSSLVPVTQINRVLDMLALDLADGNETVAKALDWALSEELKRLAAPGATYSARVKKLVYTSIQADGSPIQLSGLMVLPVQTDGNAPDYSRIPVMVSQRGTQTNSAAPPSSAAQLASFAGSPGGR